MNKEGYIALAGTEEFKAFFSKVVSALADHDKAEADMCLAPDIASVFEPFVRTEPVESLILAAAVLGMKLEEHNQHLRAAWMMQGLVEGMPMPGDVKCSCGECNKETNKGDVN